jgi:hypothetical protein
VYLRTPDGRPLRDRSERVQQRKKVGGELALVIGVDVGRADV